MRTLKVFFRSRIWRLLSMLLVLALVFALMRLVVTANYAIKFAQELGQNLTPDAAWTLGQVSWYGRIAAGLLLLIVVASFVELLYDRRLATSFAAVTRVITKFAAGDHSLRVPHDRAAQYQVRALGRAFNDMADAIQSNIKTIEERDDLRRRLVANIAHDLGTPLTSIRGYLERLLSRGETLSCAERKELVDVALKNSHVLSKLVQGLSELSRFDSANLVPAHEKFSLAGLASDVASRLSSLAERKAIRLIIEKGQSVPLVRGDVGLIERVLSNIIDNAISYTPEGGEVRIFFAAEADSKIRVGVADSGPGIPEQDIPHVCERFYRVGWERSKSGGGLGLGLAIAKEILEAHGEQLSIESTIGKGSTFSFSLRTA